MGMYSRIATYVAQFVPRSLAPRIAGIEIASTFVRAVTIPSDDGSCEFLTVTLGDSARTGGAPNTRALTDALRTVRLKLGSLHAVVSVAERKTFLYETVARDVHHIREAIESTLEARVPLRAEDVVCDGEIVRTVPEGVVVAVTALPRADVLAIHTASRDAGLMIRAIETESHAFARAVLHSTEPESVLLVDLGAHATRIAITDHGVVAYAASVDFGVKLFTSAIMKRLSISEGEAEAIRMQRGFLLGDGNRDVVEALAGPVSALRDEFERHRSFWNHAPDLEVSRLPISRVILGGAGAATHGIAEYLSDALGLPVIQADIWAHALRGGALPKMTASEALDYGTAVGLARRYRPTDPW
ncbi:pilus assembly protein PilM [Patescibacteria group bacterium]|nr:pilus assembly protein PilM [Patescibacteria group bacterium]